MNNRHGEGAGVGASTPELAAKSDSSGGPARVLAYTLQKVTTRFISFAAH